LSPPAGGEIERIGYNKGMVEGPRISPAEVEAMGGPEVLRERLERMAAAAKAALAGEGNKWLIDNGYRPTEIVGREEFERIITEGR